MKKRERITTLVSKMEHRADLSLDSHYLGFFTCFNERKYYEAHDVLEHLWLKEKGPNWQFYKGLIQLAGAFVHLQKQSLRPTHAKDGRRLRPASRLFKLAMRNIEPYGPSHMHLDVAAVLKLGASYEQKILKSDFQVNPWKPEHPPQIHLDPDL